MREGETLSKMLFGRSSVRIGRKERIPLAERERYTGTGVQNEAKWCPECFVVGPSVSDGRSEFLSQSESATPGVP